SLGQLRVHVRRLAADSRATERATDPARPDRYAPFPPRRLRRSVRGAPGDGRRARQSPPRDRMRAGLMAHIELDGVTKVYPDGTEAVSALDLDIGDGEFVVLVGPSGCGKTSVLRMVAGLEAISSGYVRIGGRVVNHLLPKDRDIAMVFQNYALDPRREGARRDASRDRAHPARPLGDDGLRHPRPDRGDDDG